MKIYIAGPYCPKNTSLHNAARLAQRNVDKAIEVFHQLKALGHYPFVPHLSHYLHIHPSCPEDYGNWWYEFDLTFLDDWAEGFFFIAPSYGASMELDRAKRLRLKIFYSIEEVPHSSEGKANK